MEINKVLLTKKFMFSASHRLYKPGLSDSENAEIFGKCSNPNGHGHNYILEVTVSGNVNDETGYVIDLGELKRFVQDRIIYKVDHKNLNLDVEFLKGINPTSENIVIRIWDVFEKEFKSGNVKLYSLKLHETENNIVEYRGGKL